VARIFISYRRTDSAAYAGRLFDRLRQHFGDAEVFMDLEGIEPGAEFGKVIAEKARAAEVLIALIGRNWLTLANAGSSRRLDDPNDLLVREIETALEAKRLVIPVLAGFARGEHLPAPVTTGIVLAVVAIVLLGQESAHPDHPAPRPPQYGLPSGMWHALASGVAIGFFFLLLANARSEAGLWPLVAARVAGIPVFAAIVVATGASFRLPRGLGWLVIGGGVLDMLANVLYLLATRYGSLAIAVTLVSLYPASTVLLARVVLRERLSRLQMIGMAGALVAVLLIVRGG